MATPVHNDVWAFGDAFNRASQKLFSYTSDEALARRREVYRHALLLILQGLEQEEPLPIGIAGGLINDQFRSIGSLDQYQDNSKGHEVQPDTTVARRNFDVV